MGEAPFAALIPHKGGQATPAEQRKSNQEVNRSEGVSYC